MRVARQATNTMPGYRFLGHLSVYLQLFSSYLARTYFIETGSPRY